MIAVVRGCNPAPKETGFKMNNLRALVLLFATLTCISIYAQDNSRGPDSPHGSVAVDEQSTLDDAVGRFKIGSMATNWFICVDSN